MDSDPVGVGDGFLVGLSSCIAFVEADGRVRWTVPGNLVDAARVGGTVIIATRGRPTVIGVDAMTGKIAWKLPDGGLWDDVAAEGGTVMLVGSSFDGSLRTVEASTGRGIEREYPLIPDSDRFVTAIVDEGLLVTAGHAGRKGTVVAADASGRIVLTAGAGVYFPDPVAVVGDVVVVQASGTTGGGVDGEPRTHLVGIDRTTRTERWRRVLPGLQAGTAVEVAGVVVVRLPDRLTGVDALSGAVRWSVPVAENYASPMIAVGSDSVALGGLDGSVAVIAVVDGQRRWSTQTEGAIAVLGVLDGALLVANDPDFYRALRVTDGTALWTTRGPQAGAGSSSGGKHARMTSAGDTAATLAGLRVVVALRRHP